MMSKWEKEANQRAKEYADQIRKDNQYILTNLNTSKANALSQLDKQYNNSIYNLNTNKSTINSQAEDNARQLDVARLLALRSNQQALNRAGLGTQGVVGSQVNSINNNYNSNLSDVLQNKQNSLNDLLKQKNDTTTQYDTSRLALSSEYDDRIANAKASIEDKAMEQYNIVYNNVMAQKQQEYENQQAELARQEAIRQYNQNYALELAQLENNKKKTEFTGNSSEEEKNVSKGYEAASKSLLMFSKLPFKITEKTFANLIASVETKYGQMSDEEIIELANKYGIDIIS